MPVLPFTTGDEWRTLPPMSVLRTCWIVLAAGAGVALIVALVRRAAWASAVFFGGLWWFATTVGLFVVVYFSPRHLYLPTAGVAIGLGLALRSGRAATVIAAGVIAWCAAAHFATLPPWREAGRVSREALAALDADLAGAKEGTIAIVGVTEKLGPVLLWAWSSPQALGAPFLAHPLPPSRVIERPVNYVRSDRWGADRPLLEMLRAGPGAVALYVGRDGRMAHRRLSREEVQARADELARLIAQGLNPDNFDIWIKGCAER